MANIIVNTDINDNNCVFKIRHVGLLSYPVGSIYQSTSNINPGSILGGIWKQIKDRFLLACGDSYSNGSTGGEATHLLKMKELPSRVMISLQNNTGSSISVPNSGGTWANYTLESSKYGDSCMYDFHKNGLSSVTEGYDTPHNNMPPYLAVYTWYRTE